MPPLLDRFGEGIEAADSDTFFVIYGDNHKPRSDGMPGHRLNNRAQAALTRIANGVT